MQQAQGHSLQRQQQTCAKWAAENGYEVVGVFAEVGSAYNGKPLPARETAYRMASFRGNCDVIIEATDRWTRTVSLTDGLRLCAGGDSPKIISVYQKRGIES